MSRNPITILVPSLGVGGAIRTAIHLAAGIADRGYCVDLVSMRNLDALSGEVPDSVRLVQFGASRVRWSLPSLVSYVKTEQPRSVIAISTVANLMALAAIRLARTSTPLLVTEHNHLSSKAISRELWTNRLSPWLARLTYSGADAIAAVSDGVADDLADITRIARERIQVIYNPTYSPQYEFQARMPLVDDWFVPEAPPVILAAGRLHPQKDFPTLLRAFREFRSTRNARLVILGEGPERGHLEHVIHQLELNSDVRLPGFDPNPFRYMSRARMFVLSSRWEGLPGVLIQAMSVGCPVVSTDCPSGASEILHKGELGRLVPVGDHRSLANAMEAEIVAPQSVERLRSRAREFSLENSVNGHLSLLPSITPAEVLSIPDSNEHRMTDFAAARIPA
ncbi:MAG: glycosyltransferase [Planctomycetaceae bacterium]|nr:glycosyltransferase [Planctomycetaceae bacterium]